jgi:hypothetical protein
VTPSVSRSAKPASRGLYQQMIVIAHQDVAVKAKMKVFYRPSEQFQKPLSVPVVPKDRLSLVASGADVVVHSRIFYPQWPGHERGFYQKR